MFLPWRDLNGRHPTAEIYRRGEEYKHIHLEAEEAMAGSGTSLNTYGKHLMTVLFFKYLGRVLSDSDDNWKLVVSNLRNNRKNWA